MTLNPFFMASSDPECSPAPAQLHAPLATTARRRDTRPRRVEHPRRTRVAAAPERPARSVGAAPRARTAHPRPRAKWPRAPSRSEEHTSELQSRVDLVCRLLLEKKKQTKKEGHRC